jgi:uncharacterized DUF497 family protein
MYEFRWNEWNIDHIAEHGIEPEQAEHVINHPSRGYPQRGEERKYLARGQDAKGMYIQAIYVFDPPGVVFVIHARPLNDSEKRRLRRGRPRS